MGKRDEINKRRGRGRGRGGGGNRKERDSCHEGNADGVWRTRERGENDFREFFPHEKADVVLTRGGA